MALLMTLNRKIHKAYSRVREGNLSLSVGSPAKTIRAQRHPCLAV